MEDIIKTFEHDTSKRILYAWRVGSSSTNSQVLSSDTDYAFIIDSPTSISKRYEDGNNRIDIWAGAVDYVKVTYPLCHICNLSGYDNLFYFCDSRIFDFIQENKQQLLLESENVVYNLLQERVNWIKTLGSDTEYYHRIYWKYNTSVMRDCILSGIMLTNIMRGDDMTSLTTEQKQLLRDIRGKDGYRVPYDEALGIVDSLMTEELHNYYRGLARVGREKIEAFNKLIEELR